MSTRWKQVLPGVPLSQLWEVALYGVIIYSHTSGDGGLPSCTSVQKEVKPQSQCPWMLLVSPGHPRALAPGLFNVSNGPGVLCVPALSLSLLQDTVMSVGHRDKPGNLLPRHP